MIITIWIYYNEHTAYFNQEPYYIFYNLDCFCSISVSGYGK